MSRAKVNDVFKGILFAGHAFADHDHTAVFARKFIEGLRAICAGEKLELNEALARAGGVGRHSAHRQEWRIELTPLDHRQDANRAQEPDALPVRPASQGIGMASRKLE